MGTTLGAGASVVGICDAMDCVIRMFGGGLLSTLGTGCTLGLGWVSSRAALNLFEMRCMSLSCTCRRHVGDMSGHVANVGNYPRCPHYVSKVADISLMVTQFDMSAALLFRAHENWRYLPILSATLIRKSRYVRLSPKSLRNIC